MRDTSSRDTSAGDFFPEEASPHDDSQNRRSYAGSNDRLRLAVVGAGVAGIVASYLLDSRHDVTLFEARERLGGHTHTVPIPTGPEAGLGVDTGFIVLNDRTYPCFTRFLNRLNVPVRWSEMSFGYWNETTGVCYAGTSLSGLFADRTNLFRTRFYRFLLDIRRFSLDARVALRTGRLNGLPIAESTVGDYLGHAGHTTEFEEHYLLPMAGAIWSASNKDVRRFPLASLIAFYDNHGLLSLSDRPRWQTVVGGSISYIRAFAEQFSGTVRLGEPVTGVRRDHSQVYVATESHGEQAFDGVIIAAHGDEALRMLIDPSPTERSLLGAWRYQRNRGYLHTDPSILPPNRRAWASWNYRAEPQQGDESPVSVTYWMNRLQGFESSLQYSVTYNSTKAPRDESIIAELDFTHPIYTGESTATQSQLKTLQGRARTWYCGSYFGYGFHEDAVRSAVDVAQTFGIEL